MSMSLLNYITTTHSYYVWFRMTDLIEHLKCTWLDKSILLWQGYKNDFSIIIGAAKSYKGMAKLHWVIAL